MFRLHALHAAVTQNTAVEVLNTCVTHSTKAIRKDTEGILQQCLQDLGNTTAELTGKASIKDLNQLMDAKADIDEVSLGPTLVTLLLHLIIAVQNVTNSIAGGGR